MLPEINEIKTQDAIIQNFKGLNQKSFSSDEEFIDMMNMASDEYPYLAPRESYAHREYTPTSSEVYVLGTCVYDSDIYTVQMSRTGGTVNSVHLYKNFQQVLVNNTPVALENTTKPRQLKKYGAYIVIFPDNVMYNTQENSVTNMSYEHTFTTSQEGRMYLSDKDGVPFICDNATTFNIANAGDTPIEIPGGFWQILATKKSDANARSMDSYFNNAINNSYLKDAYCKYIGKRSQDYSEGSALSLYKCNMLFDKNLEIEGSVDGIAWLDTTTYPLYRVEQNGSELSISKYIAQQKAWYPAELYVSWRITTTEYETIKDKVKIGDYIKLHPLKSNDADYEESDFNNREATWNLIKKLQSGMKVENIIDGEGAVVIVFNNSSLNFLKVLKENKNRVMARSVYHAVSEGSGYFIKEIRVIYNAMYFPGGNGDNTLGYKMKIEKTVPDMDYITVSANRIWGCSSANHEIYACKQGDATCWYNYGGLASDSYAVTIASEGNFTGAITFNDMPYFFKENMAYSVYGNKPSNYQVQQFKCRGVEKSAYQTLTQKDGYVYYKSTTGVERFNGNNTTSLTENLNLKGYYGQCANVCEDKLFIILYDGNKSSCYVYDLVKNMWHKEEISSGYLEVINGNLYNIKQASGNIGLDKIYGKSKETATWLTTPTYDTPKWSITSGEFNGQSMLNKYVSKMLFELKLDQTSDLSISFSYNDSDEWDKVFKTTDAHKKKLIKVPIAPKRLERMRYKIEGKGHCKIYSILLNIEGGSEVG